MRVLGLTGGIAMGKSTAARQLRRLGLPLHDADAAVHRLYARGGPAVPAIRARFPAAVVEGRVDRQVLGSLPPAEGAKHFRPDGICVDAEDAVWAADAFGGRVVRIDAQGRCTHDLRMDQFHVLACALGGEDRRTLFVCTVEEMRRLADGEPRTGRVVAVSVDVPGAGLP